MQPDQLGIARQIRNFRHVGRVVPTRENPTHMAIQKSMPPRRMDILLSVRMQVVVAVLGGPPENALLGAALSEESQTELKHPTGGVGAVREVAVISRADREDAQPVKRQAQT
jgi:hypothetical protein